MRPDRGTRRSEIWFGLRSDHTPMLQSPYSLCVVFEQAWGISVADCRDYAVNCSGTRRDPGSFVWVVCE